MILKVTSAIFFQGTVNSLWQNLAAKIYIWDWPLIQKKKQKNDVHASGLFSIPSRFMSFKIII